MSDFHVRPVVEDDLTALLPLYRAYATFYESEPTDEGLMELCRSVLDNPDLGVMLCGTDPGGNLVGFAYLAWKWSSLWGSRIGFLEDLFVDPDARGGGLADALIEECARRSRELGLPALQWLTAPDNKRAQAVYNRVGGVSEPLVEYELKL